jgi:hypothetical protein
MSITTQFTSNQNKELLWNLLIEQNSFNGIDSNHKTNIESVFERTIKIVDFNLKNDILFNKNKEVIKEMISYLNTLKKSSQVPTLSYQNKTLNYTHDEIQKVKMDRFDNDLKQKQVEFENVIKKNVPESIDFSDKMDEKIGDKMDLLISQTIAMRENQLNQILSKTIPPNKQKSIESNSPLFQIDSNTNINTNASMITQLNANINNSTNRDYIKLNIGEDVELNLSKNILDLSENNNKKVSFDETKNIYNYSNQQNIIKNEKVNELEYKTDPIKLNSFLNKLKHTEPIEHNIDLKQLQSIGHIELKNKTIVNENNKLDLIINLLNTINLKLDNVLHNNQ